MLIHITIGLVVIILLIQILRLQSEHQKRNTSSFMVILLYQLMMQVETEKAEMNEEEYKRRKEILLKAADREERYGKGIRVMIGMEDRISEIRKEMGERVLEDAFVKQRAEAMKDLKEVGKEAIAYIIGVPLFYLIMFQLASC